jgi:hypothetical protein
VSEVSSLSGRAVQKLPVEKHENARGEADDKMFSVFITKAESRTPKFRAHSRLLPFPGDSVP